MRTHRELTLVPDVSASDVILDLTDGAHPAIIDLVDARTHVPDDVRTTGLLAASTWRTGVKRMIDIVGSLLLLALASPLMLAAAIAVAVTSPGPVIYRQQRVGRDGRHFPMYKFRSMVQDAHRQRHLHEDRNQHERGPVFKIQDDPRITSVGRFLRRFSVDELPQLVNVLRGDMSLVGPRPPLPGEFDEYDRRERQRVLVRPGLTCIWQVSGRSDVDFDRWIDMDLRYIRTWSIRLDILLLLKSIPAVASGRGAY